MQCVWRRWLCPVIVTAGLASFPGPASPQAPAPAPDELLLRIQQDIQRQNSDSAQRQLQSALKSYPADARLYNFLGVLEAQQGRYSAAEGALRKALEYAPRFSGAWLNLGRLYQENQGQDAKAIEKGLHAYLKLLEFEPDNLEANYQAAVLFERQSSFRRSLQHLARLPAETQARAQALAVRCADHAGLGENTLAEATAGELLKSPDLSEAEVLSILPVLESRNQQRLATKLLDGLNRRKLASPAAVHRLALLYEHQKKFVESRACLEQVAAGRPPAAQLLMELARVAYQQRDFPGTLSYLAQARDLEPNNAGIHFFFGVVAVEMDLPLEADKSLREAVRLDPVNPWHNYAMGAVAAQGKNPDEAVPYLQTFCSLRPGDPRGRLALGVAYFGGGQYDAAKRELVPAAGRRETASGACYYLGRIAMAEGDTELAVTELHKAVGANPKFADAWAELGLAYTRKRDYANAATALDRAVALDQGGYLPNLNLLLLYQRTKDPRGEAQQKRFNEIQKKREEEAKLLLRTIEVRPYR